MNSCASSQETCSTGQVPPQSENRDGLERFKSLAQLGHLPKYDDESARAWLYGKLFLALLVEKIIRHAESVSPWGYDLAATTAAQRVA